MARAEHAMMVRMHSFAPFVATLLVCLIFVPALAQSPEVFPGVDGVELAIDSLTGRRIGVVTHQAAVSRSEEHTSELQSHSDLVCRLLLEKKKQRSEVPS